jgi:hypothetical protein
MCRGGVDMSIHGLLFQWASIIKKPTQRVGLEQRRPHHHLIEKNLFSPWYTCSWKIAELALSTNHSLTISLIKSAPFSTMREMAFLEGDYLLVHLCFTISVNLKSFSGVALQGGRATVITIFFYQHSCAQKNSHY